MGQSVIAVPFRSPPRLLGAIETKVDGTEELSSRDVLVWWFVDELGGLKVGERPGRKTNELVFELGGLPY